MNKRTALLVAGAVVCVLSCACCIVVAILADRDQEHFRPLAAACDGRGVPGAAAYVPGARNKLVYFERSASTWVETTLPVPAPLRGEGVSDTALVACAADDTTPHELEQCCFQQTVVGVGMPLTNRCMPRVQRARHVAVRVAATGALVSERDVYGPAPRLCSEWIPRHVTPSWFEGAEPGLDEMAPYFSDPTAPAPPAPAAPITTPPASAGGGAPPAAKRARARGSEPTK